jgi:hypothetical protein
MKVNKTLQWKLISIFRVWFETFLTIEIVLHIKDVVNGHFLWQVCLGAFVPVIIRWATPHDPFPDEKLK